MTLESVAPSLRMNTALADPVSSSELHGCPRSNSLLPKLTVPEITLGAERATTFPTRVGMFNVCPTAKCVKTAETSTVVSCMMKSDYREGE